MLFSEKAYVLHRFSRPSTQILKIFKNRSQGGKSRKRSPPCPPFSRGQRIRILCKTMTPTPHPSTSGLQPLKPAKSRNNNNNNGGLHACVRAAKDIEPFLKLTCLVVECESQQQFDLINCPQKQFWFPCTNHCRRLLVVLRFTVYCLFVYSAQA